MRRALVSAAAVLTLAAACGGRTPLLAPDDASAPEAAAPFDAGPRSTLFCVHGEYKSGFRDIGIYVLLDHSLSMADANKWDYATAALQAFANDPNADGMAMGLQFFPLGSACDDTSYATPAVSVAPLPGNAPAVAAALTRVKPDGDTPTLPALRGGIEYARALLGADPTREIVVAIVTDGAPDSCNSDTPSVAAAAADGVAGSPQVLTYVIGLEDGYVKAMNQIAAAGGTGQATLIGQDPSAAQEIVTTLRKLRDDQRFCRYAVPPVAGASVTAGDLAVTTTLTPGGPSTAVQLVGDMSRCDASGGFFVDDARAPKTVQLCPSSCAAVHDSPTSRLTVSAGCGAGAPDGGPLDAGGDGGSCPGFSDLECYPSCKQRAGATPPVCSNGVWTCPPPLVSSDQCNACAPVPHGCCKPDGTFAEAGCVDGAWICPPGGALFGTPGCAPPDKCAALLPCGAGEYCKVSDFTCGTGPTLGTCAPVSATCNDPTPVCGCDGQTYANACAAAAAGQDIATTQSCTPPRGTFACGPYFCRSADQICEKIQSFGGAIAPVRYTCVAAPPGCPTGCECNLCGPCVTPGRCTQVCTQNGGPQITCTTL